MGLGTATCFAPISGLVLDRIKILLRHAFVEKYTVETEGDNRLVVKYFLRDVDSRQCVESVIAETIHEILDKIAFHFQVVIGEPHIRGFSIAADHAGGKHEIVGVNLLFSCGVKATFKPGPKGIEDIRELLETDTPLISIQASFFRFALCQSNPVGRFMLLYNILLSLNGDKQVRLDYFVIKEQHGVEQTPSPVEKRNETIYTRLRNEIAHARKGATAQKAVKGIETHVSTFQAIVRTAILRLGEQEHTRR